MKKLSGLIAVFLFPITAHAAQHVNYDGHFVFATGGLAAGDSFSGQFTFNPETPDSAGYPQPMPILDLNSGVLLGGAASAYSMSFERNQASSIALNGGQTVVGNSRISWRLEDNSMEFAPIKAPWDEQLVLSPPSFYGDLITPGVYDIISISSAAELPLPTPLPPSNPFQISPDAPIAGLPNGTFFRLFALFAPETFTLDGVHAPAYQNIFEMQPLFLGFEYNKFNVGNTIDQFQWSMGAGQIEYIAMPSDTVVPLPGAAWLFGSALAGLALWPRKRA